MTLNAGHSIMVPNVPSREFISGFSEKFFDSINASKDSISKFGLFGSDIDYNTYYPGISPKEFNAEKDEFIEPVFRLLSACIVSKNFSPTEFPEEVLKASIPLLIGQTVNCDHATDIGNAIGSVVDAFWQESYTTKDGHNIPAGINGVLKIDAKANPRIARGINMDPPSIHSNSVTVQFEWRPSHSFDHPYEFWDKIGTYDENGEMIRRIVTRIISYKETSLVSHGADPYAQIIKNGKEIVNPGYASAVYNSFSEQVKEKVSNSCRSCDQTDYKSFSEVNILTHKTSKNINEGDQTSHISTNKNSNQMNKEFLEFLEKLFGEGMLSLAEGSTASAEMALEEVKKLVQKNADLCAQITSAEEQITSLKEANTQLKNDMEGDKAFVQLGKDHFKEVRESTLASYKKLAGENADQNLITLIETVDSISTLVSLKAQYDQQLEEKFPMHCADCGSHNINRASSIEENIEHPETHAEKTTAEVLAGLAEKKS